MFDCNTEEHTDEGSFLGSLPPAVAATIQSTNGPQYLAAVANATLIPHLTDRLFTHYEPLVAELAARWSRNVTSENEIGVLSCFARILPEAPSLGNHVRLLFRHALSLSTLCRADSSLADLPEQDVISLLLALLRLFTYDLDTFAEYLHPALLPKLFQHSSLAVRYLAIQCLTQTMRFADAFSESLVEKHISNQKIHGEWEGIDIDYRYVKLFEEKRWKVLREALCKSREARKHHDLFLECFAISDLSFGTVEMGGILLPRYEEIVGGGSDLVQTPTTQKNLRQFATSLAAPQPILVAGEAGSGKSVLVIEAARALGKLASMVTLQLNEQTDAKSLLGIYTSSSTTGSFVWQPGVLVKAMQEGRWVLIEDIDRAPSEVIGVIQPIIERGELFLSSRKEYIRPAAGFRVIATTKKSFSSIANHRLWSVVQTTTLGHDEVRLVVEESYPRLRAFGDELLCVHESVTGCFLNDDTFKGRRFRAATLRDLLKWCRRLDQRLEKGFSEDTKLAMFKDALDCYTAHLEHTDTRTKVASIIAQNMNVPPQQVAHIFGDELPRYSTTSSTLTIGRSALPVSSARPKPRSTFALTRPARHDMERIAAAVQHEEPVLLVGETGVGKTTLVQKLASAVHQNLTVINLSQQSEAGDLLGGLKPVTTQSLILPEVNDFERLFDETFSAKRNEKFLGSIQKSINQRNWTRLMKLWQEAVQMAEKVLPVEVRSSKRPKLDPYLRDRWTRFAARLDQLRAQIRQGEGHLLFAYTEGKLVEAVRRGDWLFLDEINLASSDTLDQIVSLLQRPPHLLLAERGSTEKIMAHPNFRIFAAMNPATDIGKKDLAPGIRSRFTELFVDAGDTHLADVTELIETYLGPLTGSDTRIANDLANAFLKIKQLNKEHRLSDGAGDMPYFSLRSLVRCLQYTLLHAPVHGLRRAVYEGFAMSFFTTLSKASEALVWAEVGPYIFQQAFRSTRPKPDESKFAYFKQHRILRGLGSCVIPDHYILTPSVNRNVENLARAASMQRFPVLLQGPTSSGKTSMVDYLAQLTGNKFVRINNHEHTDIQEYLGSYASTSDGELQYRDGVLVEAVRHGFWIVLDELNLAPSDVLEALNRLLDDNRELFVPETQELIRTHPNFMLFATQNPAGLYGGRKRLSRAFRNRFLELQFDDIPESELEVILTQRSQIAPSYCAQIVAVYKKLSLQRQAARLFEQRNSFATLRDLFRWAGRQNDDRQQLAENGFMLLAERARDSNDRQLVKQTIEEVMRLKIDESRLYSQTVKSDSVVWTAATRRLFGLVTNALRNNEPVLIVGPTGCGKTQICQVVAEAMGKRLNTYVAHANTETGDLVGSQRPLRNRSKIEARLLTDLRMLLGVSTSESPLEELVRLFRSEPVDRDSELYARIQSNLALYHSLFQWADGSLVSAMKHGEHFLLDEISLANDSVLERLNSVLEPSRSLLLAEKGSTDNFVSAASGFQLLATMNPGGDYGKRELSAALRNRLTEIWVPPLTEDDDVLPIVQAKLKSVPVAVVRAMLDFASWFTSSFQHSSQALRNLITWAEFMNTFPSTSLESSFVNGASLVFIDSVGTNTSGMAYMSATEIRIVRRSCFEKIGQLMGCDASGTQTPRIELTNEGFTIGDFVLPRGSAGAMDESLVFETPTTRTNAVRLARALQVSRPVLLEGDPGVGKTALVAALTKAVGREFIRINLSDQTDLMDLFGADVPADEKRLGHFAWRDGPLLQAMQSGGWILLDEMNLASQSVLEGLNSCLDHRQEVYIAELDRTFTCHPEFRLFAAQNPHYQGGGRKGLPASFVNRFTVVYVDPFGQEDLQIIARRRFADVSDESAETVITAVAQLQDQILWNPVFGANGGPWEFNIRDLDRWFQLLKQYPTLPVMAHASTLVVERFRTSSQRSKAVELLQTSQGGRAVELLRTSPQKIEAVEPLQSPAELPFSSLYHNLSESVYQVGRAFLRRDEHVQPVSESPLPPTSLLAPARSIITAVNRKWPIVLSGSSGSGKSTLIKNLAAISGAELIELSLNADVDTMDLIGGFEQSDPLRLLADLNRTIAGAIKHVLQHALSSEDEQGDVVQIALDALSCCSAVKTDFAALLGRLRLLKGGSPELGNLRSQLERAIHQTSTDTAQFVWNDGIIVDALQRGSWLVLDNANLCNPSVLDRLNSLLEPHGQLIVSEHHAANKSVGAIKPHPNFRIFLTVNPSKGELSRAMRNRSLEIHLTGETKQEDHSVLSYPAAAAISRIRLLRFVQDEDPRMQTEMVSFVLNHLSTAELNLLDQRSLTWLDRHVHDEVCVQLIDRKSIPFELIARNEELVPANIRALLPSVHLINQPTLELVADEALSERAYQLAQIQIFWLEAQRLKRKVADELEQSTDPKATLLRQSAALTRTPAARRVTMPPFASFLTGTCDMVLSELKLATDQDTVSPPNPAFGLILNFLKDVEELGAGHNFDRAYFQAQLQRCGIITKKIAETSPAIATRFRAMISSLGKDQSLKSGKSLQRMWQKWRPRTAHSMEQLEGLLVFEELLGVFDKLSLHITLPRSTLVKTRLRLVKAYVSALDGNASIGELVHQLQPSVQALTESEKYHTDLGHFSTTFVEICRAIGWDGVNGLDEDAELISMFARHFRPLPVLSLTKGGGHRLSRFAEISIGSSGSNIGHSTGEFVQKIQSCHEQPIGSFAYAKEELSNLVKYVTLYARRYDEDAGGDLDRLVSNLIVEVLQCHENLLTAEATQALSEGDSDTKHQQCIDLWSEDRLFIDANDSDSDLPMVWDEYYMACLKGGYPDAGGVLAYFALGSLRLIVPNQPFDPAMLPLAEKASHKRQKDELEVKIQAMKTFQSRFVGQTSNQFITKVEEELKRLGPSPAAAMVVRPAVSQLAQLQEIFSAITRSFIDRDIALYTSNDGRASVQDLETLGNAVQAFSTRLKAIDRTCDDICKPVGWLLDALKVGIAIIKVDLEKVFATPGFGLHVAKITPFIGGLPGEMLSWSFAHTSRVTETDELRLLWLERAAMQTSLKLTSGQRGKTSLLRNYLAVMNQFYLEWKTNLDRDQATALKKSRYYTYRGATTDDESAQEQAQMFPDYEEEAETKPQSGYDGRRLAIQLASLQARIFGTSTQHTDLKSYVEYAMRLLGNSPQGSDITLPQILPGALLQLDKQLHVFEAAKTAEKLNIYTDGDSFEAQRLHDLVESVMSRFRHINSVWPEHAVPVDVLACCDQIMQFSLSDPLAKLLTKTEKLFELITQWQAVASREFSAATLQEQVAQLIVRWRQLELASWSRLLDREQSQHEDDARSWYFVLYETIVVNSQILLEEGQIEVGYLTQLVQTLDEFLRTTTLGQFEPRLNLLRSFACFLKEAVHFDESWKEVAERVSTVVSYFERFQSTVSAQHNVGRAGLEKAVREQIQLASLKDTNPATLRDSARRSHHKLFRVVRKYRALLNPPIESWNVSTQVMGMTDLDLQSVESSSSFQESLRYCQNNFQGWHTIPNRLREPQLAATSMRTLADTKMARLGLHVVVKDLNEGLVRDVQRLRKLTPQTLTDDNKSLVQHLKAQKRKLLADTLKSLADMGIRRNLGSKDLEAQSSSFKVLANSPELDDDVVNSQFYSVLDRMRTVRQAPTNHSDELTDGEVRRSVGFAEGMFSVLVKQRRSLQNQICGLREFNTVLEGVKNLETTSIFEVGLEAVRARPPVEKLRERVAWLVEILITAKQIVTLHFRFSETRNDELVETIDKSADKFRALRDELAALPQFPPSFYNLQEETLAENVLMLTQDLRQQIRSLALQTPSVEYITSQVLSWLEIDNEKPQLTNGSFVTTLEEYSQQICATVDRIFVALQNVPNDATPEDVTREPAWLTTHSQTLLDTAQALAMRQITDSLSHALGTAQHLQTLDAALPAALLITMRPIFEQYQKICEYNLRKLLCMHHELCCLTNTLLSTFSTIVSEGFCSPSDTSAGEEKTGNLEAGTGLGEGEGAEDISKDVGDDEDLSELAQAEKAEKSDQPEASKDAVDLDHDELEGDLEDAEPGNDDGSEGDSGEEADLDEETGSVDDLDPSAVDEKFWDEMRKEADDKELKSQKDKGGKTDDMTAADQKGDESGKADELDDGGEENADGGDESADGVDDDVNPEAENMDQYAEEQEKMELPEDMQLNGETKLEDEQSDDILDELSDVRSDVSQEQMDPEEIGSGEQEEDKADDEVGSEGHSHDEGNEEQEKEEDRLLRTHDDEMQYTYDEEQQGDAATSAGPQQGEDSQQRGGLDGGVTTADNANEESENKKGTGDRTSGEKGGREEQHSRQDEAVKQLAEVLERWHQRHEILPNNEEVQQVQEQDVDLLDADFQHVNDDLDQGEAQASGVADEHEQRLDQGAAIEDNSDAQQDQAMAPDEVPQSLEDRLSQLRTEAESKDSSPGFTSQADTKYMSERQPTNVELTDDILTPESSHLLQTSDDSIQVVSHAEASRLWAHYSAYTRQFSLALTEQLRMILAPTMATKLRGDFRTGKRLNIKRIIPYIASQYKRDKIWMRRSVPSKRNYQIMIAVDDSKSMMEGAGSLAFETLAMLSQSLSMLEVGDLCIIGFGNEEHVRIAHPFGRPFGSESGAEVFRNFSFGQNATNVKQLVSESLRLFQDVRAKSTQSQSDLWQLELIVSDGICEDHDFIARLVRHAMEEKVMIVFVIVDSAHGSSILDLTQAQFEADTDGEMKLTMRRYLERFPFPYYLVVRDVRELPGVLATALKGWFAQVVDVGE